MASKEFITNYISGFSELGFKMLMIMQFLYRVNLLTEREGFLNQLCFADVILQYYGNSPIKRYIILNYLVWTVYLFSQILDTENYSFIVINTGCPVPYTQVIHQGKLILASRPTPVSCRFYFTSNTWLSSLSFFIMKSFFNVLI